MEIEALKLDSRTAPDIAKEVAGLLKARSGPKPDSKAKDFDPEKGASGALINIFARFAELIIERLNRVPEKNLLAFLDMLGAALLPPRPARAPLTFSLVEGAAVDAVVSAGTQVAATAVAGEKEPVIFETERELVVTTARLTSVFTRDPQMDKYADYSVVLPRPLLRPLLRPHDNAENQDRDTAIIPMPAAGVSIFEGNKNIEHVLYIAHDQIFNHPGRTRLEIKFALLGQGNLEVIWEASNGIEWKPVIGASGTITKDTALPLDNNLTPQPTDVEGIEKRWLRCRVKDAILPTRQPPDIGGISFTATFEKSGLVEKAYTNSFPVDTSRGFFPFGESPRDGDTFYLSVDEAFAELNCRMTVVVESKMITAPSGDLPSLSWEFWNGAAWQAIAVTTAGGPGVTDTTSGLTKPGRVELKFPGKPLLTVVNGVEGYWLRAKLSGSYLPGASLKPVYDNSTPRMIINYETKPAAAPLITSLTVSYKTEISAEPPELVLTCNDFAYETITRESLAAKAFTPFKPWQPNWKGVWSTNAAYLKGDVVSDNGSSWTTKIGNKSVLPAEGDYWAVVDTPPVFYLGFELPEKVTAFPNSKISIYVSASGETKPLDRPKVEWEYSATAEGEATKWGGLMVRDGTEDLTQPGLIELLAPPDFAPRVEFGLARYWLRAVLKSEKYAPRVSALLLNTVMGSRVTTVMNEVIGLSDGGKNQTFRTALAPVLEGERLEVREPDVPSPAEQEVIARENGADAISITRDESGRPIEFWVRWSEMPDFYGSGPRDRHYTINHLAGEIRFGDGSSGMIPPAGNIRMANYKTGGGAAGNRPVGSITELKTTVPYIDKVTNHIAASGGADAETNDSLLDRMPRAIRHGNRAVTFEDFEDLAMLASPETARAKCDQVMRTLVKPDKSEKQVFDRLKLIVVPRSTSAQPEPSLELKRRVLEFIDARKNPMVNVEVVKPSYVEVTVTVTICPASLEIASDLRLRVTEHLTRFLHPLAGGFERTGWDFGRQPHESDLYFLIEGIPGVDHIIALEMTPREGAKQFTQGNFLISSGKHVVACEFKGA